MYCYITNQTELPKRIAGGCIVHHISSCSYIEPIAWSHTLNVIRPGTGIQKQFGRDCKHEVIRVCTASPSPSTAHAAYLYSMDRMAGHTETHLLVSCHCFCQNIYDCSHCKCSWSFFHHPSIHLSIYPSPSIPATHRSYRLERKLLYFHFFIVEAKNRRFLFKINIY